MARHTVILGMSGGVDSSVAASLLVAQGYDVRGVTLQVWEHEDETVATSKRWQERGCCKVGLAKFVAKKLGIPHEVIDTRERFRRSVIDDFVGGYVNGITPNPCVRCNDWLKFGKLFDFVNEGHFERVGVFSYSREEGTGAFALPNQVPERTTKARLQKLMKAQARVSFRKNRALVGRIEPVLVEGYSEESELLLRGRSIRQAPDVDGQVYITAGQAEIGAIVPLRITDSSEYDLIGEIVAD